MTQNVVKVPEQFGLAFFLQKQAVTGSYVSQTQPTLNL